MSSIPPITPNPHDEGAKKQPERETREEREAHIFSPRQVIDGTFNDSPDAQSAQSGSTPEKTLATSRDAVYVKAFKILGLLEERARRSTQTDSQKKQTSDDLAMSRIDDPDAYLEQLSRQADTSQTESAELGASYDDLLDREIKQLLALPQVSELLKTEIKKELARYARAEDKLQRLRTLRFAIKKATLDMHATYLRSKRENKGTLIESAGRRIEALARVVEKAEQERDKKIADASTVDRGFINTQELIRYKRQIRESGIALTPSREKLLQKIVEHAMAGHKVFLVGSTGTGKTELAFYALNELTGDFEIIPWHEGTVMKDVLGQTQIAKAEDGTVRSVFKLGPLARGMKKGKGAVHEELTAGSTRTMMGLKPFWNLKPGQLARLPELNGEAFLIDEKFVEMFTGNPKSEQTKEREDLDPAVLRMLKGVHVQYMPSAELTKIVVAQIMDESGLLKLTKSELELIRRLAEASELMQRCHENTLTAGQQTELKNACGIDDLRLQKNFLDPGTFFGLFARWDYERRKGKTFRQYLAEQLAEFTNDPKSLGIPEEKKILLGILKLKRCVDQRSTEDHITITQPEQYEKPYILPSEMAILDGKKPKRDDDPLAEANDDSDGNPDRSAEIGDLQRDILNLLDGDSGDPNPTPPPNPPPPNQLAPNIRTFTDKSLLARNLNEWVNLEHAKRLSTLNTFGFSNLKAIDQRKYAPPSAQDVQRALTPDKLRLINTFQKPMLIMTPIGCSLKDLIQKFDAQKGAMAEHNPTKNWWNTNATESDTFDHDITGELIYHPTRYDPESHGGKTKQQLLADPSNTFKGWQVLVVEGAETTPNLNETAEDILAADLQKQLTGLTPEDDLMLQAEGLLAGQPFEQFTWKWLTGCYLKNLHKVPDSYWSPDRARVGFSGDPPGVQSPVLGSRPAVRIL